jgi:hypothetical protein
MSTTKAFEIPKSAKASGIIRRFHPSTEQPKGAPTPSVKDDLITRIGTERKHDLSDGLPITIDVQPDFRWILMSLMYYSNLYYSTIDIKNKSKTTPMTICMYFLVVITAHMLVSDLHLRHTPSFWASQFTQASYRREYFEFLLSLPVPEVLLKFIETLTETKDPRRPHVQICPSFAGFSVHHDYGRFFPPTIFLKAHTLAATVSSRDNTESVLSKLFNTSAFGNVKIGNLFGQHMTSNDNILDYNSKLIQMFYSLFNPVVERSLERRNSFAPTPVTPYPYDDSIKTNPYVLNLHATAEDITEMTTTLESVATSLSTVLSFKGQLGTLYDTLQGLDILRHGYSSFALPTWHSQVTGTPSTSKPWKLENSTQRAESIGFLLTPTPKNDTTLKFPTDPSVIEKILYLVKKVQKTENYPDPSNDFRLFHPKYDTSPRVRILDPYDLNVSTLSSVIYCGMIIETLEVDGSIVLQPDVDSTLDECNSQVLQSAVPLSTIRRATHLGSTTISQATYALDRVQHRSDSQKASTILYDAGEHRLGVFDTTVDETIPTDLPSFRIREHTSWFTRMFNVLSYKTKSPDTESTETSPNVPLGMIVAWSPYRYVAQTWKVSAQPDSTYMLLNWRTNYGMNTPLAEIPHPVDLLPIN